MAKEKVETEPTVEKIDQESIDQGGNDDLDKRIKDAMAPVLKKLEETEADNRGKTKKINDLVEEKKELQRTTLSREELLNVRLQEVDEKEKAIDKLRDEVEERARSAEYKLMKYEALREVPNFPMEHANRIVGETKEEIQLDAKNFMKIIITERNKIDNARKVTGNPKTGDTKRSKMTWEEFDGMTSREKTDWAAQASQEEVEAFMAEEVQ